MKLGRPDTRPKRQKRKSSKTRSDAKNPTHRTHTSRREKLNALLLSSISGGAFLPKRVRSMPRNRAK